MDFLSLLPDLALVNILGHMHSERDIFHLISASPESLRIYIRYRQTIARQRLSTMLHLDVDGSILQDAQAIINFPVILKDSSVLRRDVHRCLDTWDARGFPNPLMEQANPESVTPVHHFFARLIFFIEDYISKASDPFPTRAYMTLPTMNRFAPTMRFKGREIDDIEHVSFADLDPSVQRRLLQAFIRFEFRCKIYHPFVWPLIQGTAYEDMIFNANKSLSMEDHEEIYCVSEYLNGMYSAIIVQSDDDIWFPDRPSPTTDHGLLFPDTYCIRIYTFVSDADLDLLAWKRMPNLGLDPLSALLQYLDSHSSSRYYIRDRVQNFSDNQPYGLWTATGHFLQQHRLYFVSTQVRRLAAATESSDNPMQWRSDTIDDVDRQINLKSYATAMYRQRAGIFFTGSVGRQPNLPSWDEFILEEERANHIMGLEERRQRRRSHKWRDDWAGQTLNRPSDDDSSINQENEEDYDDEESDDEENYGQTTLLDDLQTRFFKPRSR
ncbi:hypothetical protein FPSE_10534 [Fusarium pseudograminearum CS3096]|uniref:F-box domain-containing protein n=1 Tax=Fusarium pseudograminearum (strain CS3096) TaxID=1028729 RepID=K3UCT3_FUSPC|nr:hypothetical protein FPSE_10534 [Fusarium pseudograminearum CS3096]EKJ69281.1 hypothetical protein FPSE_10534 [Fusarium pseudograminearum CS3096]KAF0638590.1 hypothetical protein FPSE5266_10534 [Fusarium pseudograminearum]